VLSFETRNALVDYIRSSDVSSYVKQWLSNASWSWKDVVTRSIDGTTFRAFHTKRFGDGPSILYRRWGHAYFPVHISAFTDADTPVRYQYLIDTAVEALQAEWPAESDLDFGRAAKMINLTLKHCLLLHDRPATARDALATRLHVALDRYTLLPIARLDQRFGLPALPTMKSVQSRAHYLALQEWVRGVCDDAQVTPLMYEFALFNLQRGDVAMPERTASSPTLRRTFALHTVKKATAPRQKNDDGVSVTWLDSEGQPASASLPRTDSSAGIVSVRRVENARALKVSNASYRGAAFDGIVELADSDNGSHSHGEGGRPRVRLRWFDHVAARGFVSLKVDRFETIENYSGDVVDSLGRKP